MLLNPPSRPALSIEAKVSGMLNNWVPLSYSPRLCVCVCLAWFCGFVLVVVIVVLFETGYQ